MEQLKEIKILLVHSQLAQHGSEKLLYEISKLLVRQGFSVDVLVRPYFVKNQYYYQLLRQIGVGVIHRLITFRHITFLFKSLRSSTNLLALLLRWIYSICAEVVYFSTARTYDRIVIIGMETYCDTFRFMRGDKSNIYVHHVMHKFQQDRDYSKEYDLRFIILGDDRQSQEISESLPNINKLMFPLPIDLQDMAIRHTRRDYQNSFIKGKLIRIGVVSRIKKDRPNEPIIRHFAALSTIMPIELHFFGSGDPKIYSDIINELKISSQKIIFHGHSHSISTSFEEVGIDIAWSVAMMESISYAALELIAIGVPVFFINIGNAISDNKNHSIKSSNSESETVCFHKKLCQDSTFINKIIADQKKHIHNMYNSKLLNVKIRQLYDLE